jgi:SAM-dependent methyltransferase
LRYACQDLRQPLAEGGFDVALNIFTSVGYGTELDDLAVLSTLRNALCPGGLLLLDTMHRDAVAAGLSHGGPPHARLPDGTLLVEEPRLDPIHDRLETCWYWAGPQGTGRKVASLRIYTVAELVRLLEQAGLRFRAAHAGCTPEPFVASGPMMGGRIGILAERPAAGEPE